MYVKYVKVELLLYFGLEYFCLLSFIRVFGISMVEEYEEIVDFQYYLECQELFDEDYDYLLDYNIGEDKFLKNFFGFVINVILNMVNIVVNILGVKIEDLIEGNKSIFENVIVIVVFKMFELIFVLIFVLFFEYVIIEVYIYDMELLILDILKESFIVQLV